ncbi:MAG TPA: polysaccharide biosynthesis/export family protein [Hyphomonadaceae bacterium]|nr:polysaccharide biosynthesis/export family protein [Hyphomonadaceae bacterium]HPN05269.1 polysaccharide biosynthesis/export family protein [Hyphomonadaceae bacterium]
MIKNFLIGLALLTASLGSLTACQTTGAPAGEIVSDQPPQVMRAEDYRLGPGDDVRITVFGQDNLTGRFVVTPQGSVSYPLIGEVTASGLTITELNKLITERLQAGYVLQPRVSIEMATYRPFYILGEVGRPGTYPFSAGLTVMNAVATAGGFSYRANSQVVYIKHGNETFERRYALTSSTSVQPGDTVRISERTF